MDVNTRNMIHAQRWSFVTAIGIFILALAVRLFYLYESSDNPTFSLPIVDSNHYDMVARTFVAGKGMDKDFFWQPFFYPLFLSIVYSFSGSSIVWAKIIQAVLGAISCLLTWRLGCRLFRPVVGLIAGIITALYGPLIFIEGELLGEGWAAFWSVVLLLLLLRIELSGKVSENRAPGKTRLSGTKATVATRSTSMWVYLILGVCGALSAITRPTFVPFLAGACLWVMLQDFRLHRRWAEITGHALTIMAGFIVIIMPVAVQSHRVTGEYGILPQSGSLNVYIGNNRTMCQTIMARPGLDWEQLCSLPERNGIKDLREKRRYYYRQVYDYILHEPWSFCKGTILKTMQFLSSRELPRNLSIYLFHRWSGFLSVSVWKIGGFGFPFGVLLPLAVVGLICHRKEVSTSLILYLCLYSASIIVVFVSGRYRSPIIPAMSVLAAAGCCALAKWLRHRQWKPLGVAVGGGIGLAVATSLPGPFCMETQQFEAELHHFVASSCLERKGSNDLIVSECRTALKLRPDYSEAHNNLGTALADMGKTDEAIAHFREAIRLRPDHNGAHYNLGKALAGLGHKEDALREYREALRLNPLMADAHNNMGITLAEIGQWQEAVAHHRQALDIKPDFAEGHHNLAKLLADHGQFEEAIKHYNLALRFKPDYADAHCNLGAVLADQGKHEEAMKHYLEALRLDPRLSAAHNNMANSLAGMNRLDEAIPHYQEAIKLRPNYAEAYSNLGAAYYRKGQMEAAIEQFNQALKIQPDNPNAHNNLAMTLGRMGRLEEAIQHFREAMRSRPNDPSLHYFLGIALMDAGRLNEAVNHLQESVKLNPDDPQARNALASVLEKQKRPQ